MLDFKSIKDKDGEVLYLLLLEQQGVMDRIKQWLCCWREELQAMFSSLYMQRLEVEVRRKYKAQHLNLI